MKKVVAAVLMVVCVISVGSVTLAAGDNISPVCKDGSGVNEELKKAAGCKDVGGVESKVGDAINVVIYALGIVAVVMIVFAGQRYIVSQGDPTKVKKAKDMIMYSVIGLIVAILAYAIVNFVLKGIL